MIKANVPSQSINQTENSERTSATEVSRQFDCTTYCKDRNIRVAKDRVLRHHMVANVVYDDMAV